MTSATGSERWGEPVPRDAAEAAAFALGEGVWRLRLPLPYKVIRVVNAYAIALPDGGCCLVDCGSSLAPGWDALEVALAGAGYAPSDVRILVATHSHADHFGLAATLIDRTGCALWCAPGPRHVVDAYRDPLVPLPVRRERARRAGVPAARIDDAVAVLDGGDGHHDRPEPVRELRDGDVLEAADDTWRVVPAPGHARNQLVLHGGRTGWLISADLALAGVSAYLEHGYGGDPVAQHIASVRRALALAPTRLLPGHGRPVDDPRPVLAGSADAVRDRLAGLRARLDDVPRTPYTLSLDLAGGPDPHPDRLQMALSTTSCDVDHLERAGAARRVPGADGVARYVRGGG